jgi:D-alanine-D-alanine ligase
VAKAVESTGLPVKLIELQENHLPDTLDPHVDLILPVIHGKYGEDGRLSAELDRIGFAYAGCQQAASVICYDKVASKSIAARQGIPVAVDHYVYPESIPDYRTLANLLGSPFIMKPRFDGSSVGLHLVNGEDAYDSAREDLVRVDYVAEAFVEGIDLTAGILGNDALGVVSIHPKGGLYDYEHKYTSGKSEYRAPAEIDDHSAQLIRQWSKSIFRACGCRDLARVDFRMTASGEVFFLEINTIPGMTPTSLLPKSAQCCGISFTNLVLAWIGFAFGRFKETH